MINIKEIKEEINKFKLECPICKRELIGYSSSQILGNLKQHYLANHIDQLSKLNEEIKQIEKTKEEKASDETNTSSSLHSNEEVKDE